MVWRALLICGFLLSLAIPAALPGQAGKDCTSKDFVQTLQTGSLQMLIGCNVRDAQAALARMKMTSRPVLDNRDTSRGPNIVSRWSTGTDVRILLYYSDTPVKIPDEPKPTVYELTSDSLKVAEGEQIEFTLTRSTSVEAARIPFEISVAPGDVGLTAERGEFVFRKGSASASLSYPDISGYKIEADQRVTLQLYQTDPALTITTDHVVVQVVNQEEPELSALSVRVEQATVPNGDKLRFIVTRTGTNLPAEKIGYRLVATFDQGTPSPATRGIAAFDADTTEAEIIFPLAGMPLASADAKLQMRVELVLEAAPERISVGPSRASGTISAKSETVSTPVPPWIYICGGLIAAVALYMIYRGIRPPPPPNVDILCNLETSTPALRRKGGLFPFRIDAAVETGRIKVSGLRQTKED